MLSLPSQLQGRDKMAGSDVLRDDLVELNVVEVADDGQDAVEAAVEDVSVQEKDDLYDCGCRQDVRFDVELDVQDVGDVLEVDNVGHDVFEERGMLCGVVVDVEVFEDDVEVVDVAQHEVDEVDDVQDETVVAKLVENEIHDRDVRAGIPDAG